MYFNGLQDKGQKIPREKKNFLFFIIIVIQLLKIRAATHLAKAVRR